MRFISWNVNGLRAAVGKGFSEYFKEADADIFSLQETKLQAGQIDLETEGYHQYWNYAERCCGVHEAGAAFCCLWYWRGGA